MRVLIVALLALGVASTAQAASETLKRIKNNGEIRIGYREATEPFSFKGEDGRVVGYSIDMCGRIATGVKTELGVKDLKTTYVPVTLTDRFDALESGKIDILCAATTITLSRMAKMDFTVMTFVTGGGFMSLASAPIQLATELSGKTVAVVAGSTSETGFATFLEESFIDANIVKAASLEAAQRMLDAGEADVVAGDQIGLIGQIVVSEDPRKYKIAEDLFSYEPYALAVQRDDPEFLLIANRALVRTYRTGQFKQVYDQWFGRIGLRPTPILQAMYTIFSFPE